MRVVRHRDARTFWETAKPILAADPVRHTGMLSVAGQLVRGIPFTDAEPIMVTVHSDADDTDAAELRGAALCTPPFPINISALPVEAAPVVVRHLVATGVRLAGARGPDREVNAFVAAWVAETGDEPRVTMTDRLYRLDVLLPPVGVPGEFRLATDEDFPLLARWRAAFEQEAMRLDVGPDRAATFVRQSMAGGTWFGLWVVGGRPVAMASATGPVEAMSRIGAVYTPPAERGHGYGSAATASVTRWALDHGATDMVLHADLANPVSNAIYQRMGYRGVHDGRAVALVARN